MKRKAILLFVSLVAIWTPPCLAQTYQIDWYVIGSGGGHASSGSYQIDGTIGQPIIGQASSANYQIDAGFWVGAVSGGTCNYLIGDISGDDQRLGGDVTYGVRYLKGIGTPPRDSCYMDSTHTYLYVAADCNGNCEFRGSDITRLVSYFKGISSLSCCHFFPTTLPPYLRELQVMPVARD
jgi:hypothetical protein